MVKPFCHFAFYPGLSQKSQNAKFKVFDFIDRKSEPGNQVPDVESTPLPYNGPIPCPRNLNRTN
jgi:hypothetical protein